MSAEPASAGRRWPLNRTELGLLAAIAVVIGLTAALDSQHSYLRNP